MPMIDGVKYACEPCMRGHRSSKCNHDDRILIKVRKPGRPLSSCPHEAGSCNCEVASVAIPKISSACPCGSPAAISKSKKDDKAPSKYDNRSRPASHTSSGPGAPAAQPNINYPPPYGFPGGFLPNMENPTDMISPMDQNHIWQPQGPNPINLGGIAPLPPHPMDLSSSMTTPFFGHEMSPGLAVPPPSNPLPNKGGCCKPEPDDTDGKNFMEAPNMFPVIQSPSLTPNAQQYGDYQRNQQLRRHTTELFARKRASLPGYPTENDLRHLAHGVDARSTSMPNVPVVNTMANGIPYGAMPEESHNQAYTIYTAPRYNQKQIVYMNAIREAHERHQQEEAEAARRASQAGEHARTLSGPCCAPSNNNPSGSANNDGSNNIAPYALPHGQDCECGPNCSCIMCITHPYNSATIEYVRNIHQTLQTSDQSSGEHSPSTMGFAHSVAGVEFPPNSGGMGVFGDIALDSMSEDKDLLGLQSDRLSPSAFIQFDYPMGSCSQQNGSCMCGDGCTCVGCLTHGGHNGVAFLDASDMLSPPATVTEHQPERVHEMSDPTGNPAHGDRNMAIKDDPDPDNMWKNNEPANSSGVHAPVS